MGAYFLLSFILMGLLLLQIEYSSGQCSGSSLTLTATTTLQAITSPNFPYSYDNNDYCDWTISSTSDQVVFYIVSDYIESYYDKLWVYGASTTSNKLFDSENYNSPFVSVAPGSDLRVIFDTDSSVTYGGFLLYYMGVSSLDSCGQTLTATTTAQQLTYVYRDAWSTCVYTINSANLVKVTLDMQKNDVEIKDDGAAAYTYIDTVGSIYISSTTSVTIRGSNGNDFVITYEEVSSGSNSILTTESPSQRTECIGSGNNLVTVTSSTQFLTSVYYPGAYLNNDYCNVLLEAQNTNDSIYFYVHDNMIAYGDNLRIYDGPSSAFNQFGSMGTFASYTSSGYSVFIEFTTNYYGVDRGFNISFYSVSRVDPLSGVTYTPIALYNATTSEQSIYSPNWPSNYDNNLDEYWLITKPNQDDTIVVDFHTLIVEDALNCVFDKVTFYDGNTIYDPILLEKCGTRETYIEDSTGLYILVRFETDSSVTMKGFRIVFYVGGFNIGGSEEEEDEGLPSWAFAVIGLIAVILIAIVVTLCICLAYKRSKQRVGIEKEGKSKPKLQKRTTQQLLTEITKKYGAKINEPKRKVFRKRQGDYHPQPNTPGPDVNVITVGKETPLPPPFPPQNPSPNPPPNLPPPGVDDPVFPPPYQGPGGDGPPGNIAPVFTNIPQTLPNAPLDDPAFPPIIPPPFNYITPAEARANGTYPN